MSRMTAERTSELYAVVLELLTEDGYDNLTMDKVAARARSSKATLYRQWGNKEGLVVEALKTVVRDPSVPDTGTLRGDFHELIKHGQEKENIEVELIGAVIHACKTHPELGPIVRERIISSHRVAFETVLARAVTRGELAADAPALRFALIMLTGPSVLRELIDGKPADEAYLMDYVDAVFLPALGVHSPLNPF
ncbi:TetR/AcrR family transcriptional regulator [soil metagenome]